MKRLFLDDWRFPIKCAEYMYRRGIDCKIYHEEWIIVRSYGEFVEWITANGLPDMISFDHDLADVVELKENLSIEKWFDLENNKEYTGADCAQWLINYCIDNNKSIPEFTVHSDNPGGSDNINGKLIHFRDKYEQIKNLKADSIEYERD